MISCKNSWWDVTSPLLVFESLSTQGTAICALRRPAAQEVDAQLTEPWDVVYT